MKTALIGVDCGIRHLAFVVMDGGVVLHSVLADLCFLPACDDDCPLPHTKETVDRLAHFFVLYGHHFDAAKYVLIERQPPGGLQQIQDAFFRRYRAKAHLVSPNSVHKHFSMPRKDYEGRKRVAVEIARGVPGVCLSGHEREHDIADAVLLVLFWMQSPPPPPPAAPLFAEYEYHGS
jgi:hypothetical protein